MSSIAYCKKKQYDDRISSNGFTYVSDDNERDSEIYERASGAGVSGKTSGADESYDYSKE